MLVLLYKQLLYSCLWLIELLNYIGGFSPSCFSIAKVLEYAVHSPCMEHTINSYYMN